MPRIPSARIEFVDESKPYAKLTPKLKKAAIEGLQIQREMDALKKRLEPIKKLIKETVGEDVRCSIKIDDHGAIPLVPKKQTIVADPDRLSQIFGNNFANYVKSSMSFDPLDPLEELLKNEDAPTHDMAKECVTFKNTCALSFKPSKK